MCSEKVLSCFPSSVSQWLHFFCQRILWLISSSSSFSFSSSLLFPLLFTSATFGIHLLILSNNSFISSFSSPSLKLAPSVVMLQDERERKLEMISAWEVEDERNSIQNILGVTNILSSSLCPHSSCRMNTRVHGFHPIIHKDRSLEIVSQFHFVLCR